jgi:hypothetical protein
MKRWRIVGQCTALVGAIVLVGGYVYVQAGGRLWPWHSQSAGDEKETPIMSSSKLGVIRLRPGGMTDEASQESPPVPPTDAPADAPPRGVIMAGSKSAAIFVPDMPPPPQPTTPPEETPRQETPPLQQAPQQP